ncbi:MAG TPA: F0F1 ATP synthase subunit delta, partial [Corynebacterium sp.]|nr:F0F1 ATP synthase subunit delta [Corynebacterium sp.]
MHAASREALAQSESHLDELVAGALSKVTVATTIGTDLFVAVDRLDAERSLRIAVADVSYEPEQRAGIIDQVFQGKVSESSQAVLTEAAS